MSRARLHRAQGRGAEARPELKRVLGCFEEGLETPDLRDAAALVDELG
jgi:hypothetical protein